MYLQLSAWHEMIRTVTKDVTVEAGKVTSMDFQLKKRKLSVMDRL
jgi:hypothetical protein